MAITYEKTIDSVLVNSAGKVVQFNISYTGNDGNLSKTKDASINVDGTKTPEEYNKSDVDEIFEPYISGWNTEIESDINGKKAAPTYQNMNYDDLS